MPPIHRIIFDTDSAVFNDDAAALAMLLQRPDVVDILGITVVAGNHTVPLTRPSCSREGSGRSPD